MFTKKIVTCLVISCFFNSIVFAATEVKENNTTSAKKVVDIQTWQTQQGTPVYFVATSQLPIVDIQVAFNAGSAQDGAQFGIANFVNGMLNEGTSQATADQIATQFDRVGAAYSNSVNRDMSVFALRSLSDPKYFNTALSTFLNVLTQPSFPADGYERVKKQILNVIEDQKQSPAALASIAFSSLVYANHPYAHPIVGNVDTVQKITVNNLQQFYKKFYVAKNATIVIVGDLSHQTAQDIAEQISQSLPQGEVNVNAQVAPALTKALTQHVNFPSQQTTVMMGQVGINQQDPDYFPLMVGNYTLGGGLLVSRLIEVVREKNGLAYSVRSGFIPHRDRGPFVISLQTRNNEVQRAIGLVDQTLQQFVQAGPTADELDSAKKYIIGNFPLSIASNADIAGQVLNIAFYQLPLNYLDTYRDKVSAVNIDAIKNAFHQRVQAQPFATVTVGPQLNAAAAQSNAKNTTTQ